MPNALLTGLFTDSVLLFAEDSAQPDLLRRHLRLRADHPDWIHSLLITDRAATQIDRLIATVDDSVRLPVTVINTTGAGGLTSLAERSFDRLDVVAVDSPLRDPGDPVGNLMRIAATARLLDPETVVRVQIPYGFGWQDAIAEADAEGLQGHLDCSDTERLAERISAHIEADLGFAADLPGDGLEAGNLICAVDALIDDADHVAATAWLAADDHDRVTTTIAGFDPDRVGRVRRRLYSLRCADVSAVLDRLKS